MRKNSKNLISALIAIIAILCAVVIFAPKTVAGLNLNLELGNGQQLIYKTEAIDEETVKNAAEVLKKRISNFGAVDVEYTIENNQITLNYTGIKDNDTMRKYLTNIGKLSFRDYNGKELMGRAVLNETMPLGVAKNDDKTLLYIFVADSKEFSANTLMLSAAEKKYMVVWVDYDEKYSFENEQSKTDPAYLAAATVSQAINETCYIQSAHDYETTKNVLAVVNGGELPCTIEEIAFNELVSTAGTNGAAMIINSMWIIVALNAVLLIGKYRLAGAVSSLMLALYVVTTTATISAFGVIFDSVVALLLVLGLFIGIYYLFAINRKINEQINIGLLEKTAVNNAYQKSLVSAISAYLIAIFAGLICYLFFKNYFAGFAITLLTIAITSLIVFVLWNKFMLTDLIVSNYFDKKIFGYKENATNVPARDYTALSKSKVSYILLAVSAVFAVLFVVSVKENWKVCLFALIVILVASLAYIGYLAYKNKKAAQYSFTISALFSLSATMAVIYLSKYTSQENIGFMMTAVILLLVLSAMVVKQFSDSYDLMIKNKLTVTKIETLFNETFDGIIKNLIPAVIGLIIFIAILVCLKLSDRIILTVLFAVVVLLTICLSASLWLQYMLKNYRKPKGNRKNTSEKTERVIFGIND